MVIKLHKTEEGCEVFLSGRLDAVTSPEAEKIIGKIRDEYMSITFDLLKLEYVSSAGLRIFKNLHIAMKDKKGELYFRNVRKNVSEVLELTGLAGLFQFK